MQALEWFLTLQILVFLLSPSIAAREELQEFKPEELGEEPEKDALNLFSIILIGTIVLILIKLLGISLQFFIDLSVFFSGIYLAILLSAPLLSIPTGIALVLMRWTDDVLLFNLSTAASVVTFSTLFSLFLQAEGVLLLIAALSLYDAIAVFYTKHMKFLWLRCKLDTFRRSLLFLFPKGEKFSVIGAGDFALPLLFTISFASKSSLAGILALIFSTAGFVAMEYVSGKTEKIKDTGIPGIPFIGMGCAFSALLSSAFHLI